MYSIYADNLCIYSGVFLENNDYKLTAAKLTLSDNSAGQFTLTIPKSNAGYDAIVPMDTTITIKKDGDIFWEGRVISGKIDFRKNKQYVCEGVLAYLNDTIQTPTDYSKKSISSYLSSLLQKHNSRVSANRRIQLGNVTVVDSAYVMNDIKTGYDVTYDAVNSLVSQLGGHLIIRHDSGMRYLDYLADYPGSTTQKIEFGKNLLDLAQDFDETEYCTVVIPLGASAGADPDTNLDTYITVASVNHGSIYVESSDAIAEHGRIERTVNFDNIEDPTLLYALGVTYLQDTQFNNLVLDVSALDLNLVDNSIEEINLLDKITVISKPHGINKEFPVVKVNLDLLAPENNTYTLGTNLKDNTLSQQTNSANAELAEKVNQLKETNALEFYRFENKHEFDVTRRTRLCNIRFATKRAGLINWQAEILAQITADAGYKAKVKFYYYLNNALIEYFPTETLETGQHIFSLYFPLEVETLTSYEWRVEIEVEHGRVIIPIGDMRGVIWGDKLVAQVGWNGYIDLDDRIEPIELDSIGVKSITGSLDSVGLYLPLSPECEDEFSAISLEDNIDVAEFVEVVYVNKTSLFLEGYTWADLLEMDWGEVFDNHLW